jgi:hypothetical protein
MRRLAGSLGVALLGGLMLHGAASAQTHVEMWGGLTVGSHTATAAGLDVAPALSIEALVVRQLSPWLGIYGGYVHTAFGCEEGFCLDRGLTVTGDHAVLGGEVRRGRPWLRVGLLFGVAEVGTEGEAPEAGVGIHAGAGLTVGAGRVRFLPGFSYRWMAASTTSSSAHAVALALDLGVGVRLGSDGP